MKGIQISATLDKDIQEWLLKKVSEGPFKHFSPTLNHVLRNLKTSEEQKK